MQLGPQRCVPKEDTLSPTNPAGCAPPIPVGPLRACKSASCSRPRGRANPGACGSPRRQAGNKLRTSNAEHRTSNRLACVATAFFARPFGCCAQKYGSARRSPLPARPLARAFHKETSDHKALNKRWLAAVHGVPALAGTVLSLEGCSKLLEIHDETASDRLKPGLHTPRLAPRRGSAAARCPTAVTGRRGGCPRGCSAAARPAG